MSINTSFIIPHKGREDMLIETLTSIAGLTTPKEQYEVVLVSQNKEISNTLSAFIEKVNLRVLYNEENKYISFSVGGAITSKSTPEKEYEECLLKAKAMKYVLTNSD